MQSELEAALQGVEQAVQNARDSERHAKDEVSHWKAEAAEWQRRWAEEKRRVDLAYGKSCKVSSLDLPPIHQIHHRKSSAPRGIARRHTEPYESAAGLITRSLDLDTSLASASDADDHRPRPSRPSEDSEHGLSSLSSMLAASLFLHNTQKLLGLDPHISRTDSLTEHTTVSVADDGRSGVGATAAAAVSVALAQSWAAVANGSTSAAAVRRAQLGIPKAEPSTGKHDKARFKLVAAVPRSRRQQQPRSHDAMGASPSSSKPALNGDDRSPSHTPVPPSERGMALDSLDDARALDDDQEATWRASGSHLKMHWLSPPTTVLVCWKPVPLVFEATATAIAILLRTGLTVYIEPEYHIQMKSAAFTRLTQPKPISVPNPSGNGRASTPRLDRMNSGSMNSPIPPFGTSPASRSDSINSFGLPPSPAAEEPLSSEEAEAAIKRLVTWQEGSCSHVLPDCIADALDAVITLGGDGTVLWACSLFGNSAVPPLVPLAMGSLGFMTPFPISRMETILDRVLGTSTGFPIMLRHRLQCQIIRRGTSLADLSLNPNCGEQATVLNEVVFNRGGTASLAYLQCYVDRNFVTVIQGDGLIVSTPTGSTAYNLAAGGSMVHPSVPCVLFTPICPHTLSSRPLVFPEHVALRVKVPEDSRSEAYCTFDGKSRQVLNPGDSVLIHLSEWPVPMVCNLDASHDWFLSVREGLNWNLRKLQSGKGA